jgi:hypothetical protein
MKLRRLARKEGNEFSHKTYKTGKTKVGLESHANWLAFRWRLGWEPPHNIKKVLWVLMVLWKKTIFAVKNNGNVRTTL